MTVGSGRPFDEPIKVPGGELVTLLDAGRCIASLPKALHDRSEWLAAVAALLLLAPVAPSCGHCGY